MLPAPEVTSPVDVPVPVAFTDHALSRWHRLTRLDERAAVQALQSATQFDRTRIWGECQSVKHNTVCLLNERLAIVFVMRPADRGLVCFNVWRLLPEADPHADAGYGRQFARR